MINKCLFLFLIRTTPWTSASIFCLSDWTSNEVSFRCHSAKCGACCLVLLRFLFSNFFLFFNIRPLVATIIIGWDFSSDLFSYLLYLFFYLRNYNRFIIWRLWNFLFNYFFLNSLFVFLLFWCNFFNLINFFNFYNFFNIFSVFVSRFDLFFLLFVSFLFSFFRNQWFFFLLLPFNTTSSYKCGDCKHSHPKKCSLKRVILHININKIWRD